MEQAKEAKEGLISGETRDIFLLENIVEFASYGAFKREFDVCHPRSYFLTIFYLHDNLAFFSFPVYFHFLTLVMPPWKRSPKLEVFHIKLSIRLSRSSELDVSGGKFITSGAAIPYNFTVIS